MNNPAKNPAPLHFDLIRQEAGKAMGLDCSNDPPQGPGDFPTPGLDVVTV